LYLLVAGSGWLVFTGPGRCHAQSAEAYMAADLSSINLGEPVQLTLTVVTGTGFRVQMPATPGLPQGLEVLQTRESDTSRNAGKIIHRRQWTITGFEPGTYTLPPIRVFYVRTGSSGPEAVETERIDLTVLAPVIPEEAGLRPMRGLAEAPLTWRDILPWVGICLLLVALAGGLVWWRRRPRPVREEAATVPAEETAPAETPSARAIRQLNALAWPEASDVSGLAACLEDISQVIRVFVQEEWAIPAPELTTRETLMAFAATAPDTPGLAALKTLLEVADMAKFARFAPAPDTLASSRTQALDIARSLVRPEPTAA
jgi:hypothetical protein